MKPPPELVEHLMVDGILLPTDTPALKADLPGILRGEGIFETFLVVDGSPTPFLSAHQDRLVESASIMDMNMQSWTLQNQWEEYRTHVPAGRQRVRFTLLRSIDDNLVRIWTSSHAVFPPAEIILSLSRFLRYPDDPLSRVKTTSRALFQLARREAEKVGAYEALLSTPEGDWTEGTVSNLLIIKKGRVKTPPLHRGVLAGVTRHVLLSKLHNSGIVVQEEPVTTADLEKADEVYVTSALLGVTPVCRIVDVRDDLPGASGPMLPRFLKLFQEATQDPSFLRS
jgi:branched-subunit amino acid aminotransferase/4-amino-4-deoxychorismate lyase